MNSDVEPHGERLVGETPRPAVTGNGEAKRKMLLWLSQLHGFLFVILVPWVSGLSHWYCCLMHSYPGFPVVAVSPASKVRYMAEFR